MHGSFFKQDGTEAATDVKNPETQTENAVTATPVMVTHSS